MSDMVRHSRWCFLKTGTSLPLVFHASVCSTLPINVNRILLPPWNSCRLCNGLVSRHHRSDLVPKTGEKLTSLAVSSSCLSEDRCVSRVALLTVPCSVKLQARKKKMASEWGKRPLLPQLNLSNSESWLPPPTGVMQKISGCFRRP